MHRALWSSVALCVLIPAGLLPAQHLPVEDPVLRRIWTEGTERSQVVDLLQTLSDSIGPRLTGSPGMLAGQRWLQSRYAEWDIASRSERYGTWTGWRRGKAHLDLVAPRVRSLEGSTWAWSPGTGGKAVEAAPIVLEEAIDSVRFAEWLPRVRGKFVLASFDEPTCRPDADYAEWAGPEEFLRMDAERTLGQSRWAGRWPTAARNAYELARRLESAGAVGIISSNRPDGWGTTQVSQPSRTSRIPSVVLSCEDYGLVYRLAERRQAPVLRLEAEAEFDGDMPVYNVIAEIRGRARSDEYVMLSAHFDSWDGASGTTDNGTGTVVMLEAMRILRVAYPNPKRTILVGHWSGEEQGLNGSHAFVEDHPEIVSGLQALFNQDDGTGRTASIQASGFVGAGEHLARWLSRVPTELSQGMALLLPGVPAGGGTDNAAFVCAGAPGFGLNSESAEYSTYTHHTNRDTYDKVIPEHLRFKAMLVAMLVYLAAEDSQKVPRDRRIMPLLEGGGQEWPSCKKAARSRAESDR